MLELFGCRQGGSSHRQHVVKQTQLCGDEALLRNQAAPCRVQLAVYMAAEEQSEARHISLIMPTPLQGSESLLQIWVSISNQRSLEPP